MKTVFVYVARCIGCRYCEIACKTGTLIFGEINMEIIRTRQEVVVKIPADIKGLSDFRWLCFYSHQSTHLLT